MRIIRLPNNHNIELLNSTDPNIKLEIKYSTIDKKIYFSIAGVSIICDNLEIANQRLNKLNINITPVYIESGILKNKINYHYINIKNKNYLN